ncbi:TonB-dependent receptor [Rhizobium sp. G187]|uniref:TonB-dependent receptor n=1 Tax=Rhizobium sp. G187 TaxID=3451352 RepID=UPI003EE56D86
MSLRSSRILMLSASAIALSLPAYATFAQDAAGDETVLDAIVVTGEKVARSLSDTASSVAVKDEEDIKKEEAGNASIAEAITDVPNVVYTDNVGAPVIRGQDSQGPNTGSGAFFAGTVPRASVNLDGHYMNYFESIYGSTSIWDVDSIEVFRGPQTTSQGANAIGGAIIVNSKDPTFTPEASYQAEIGSYNTKRASVALSGPIIDEELAGRIAIDYAGRDTFIDYVNAAFLQGDTDQNFDAFNARGKLLWEPSEIPGLSAKLTLSHNSGNRPSQEAAQQPYDDLESYTTTMPSWDQRTNTAILDVTYDFDNGISWFNQTQYSASDVERLAEPATNGNAVVEQANISHESRVNFGSEDDVLSGMAGVYYAHTTSDEYLNFSGITTFDDTKDNLGIFGELSYKLAEQWTLTGGLRYQRDHIQRAGTYTGIGELDYDETFDAILPKLTLAYDVTPDWTVGGLISRGYNPGGASLRRSPNAWLTFEEETVTNYELFTRAELLEDKLFVNANIFYMDFKNAQRPFGELLASGVTQYYTINAEKAHAYGMEAAFEYQALDNLTLKGGAGLLRTEIDEMSASAALEGNEFLKSPGYMVSFGASWDVTEKFNLSAEARHLDNYYSDDANSAAYAVDAYTLADVRASYKIRDEMEVYGYVKNVFDERAPTYVQYNRGTGGIEASITTPRLFGIGVRGTF